MPETDESGLSREEHSPVEPLSSLFGLLDTVILERRSQGRFRQLTDAPLWLRQLIATSGVRGADVRVGDTLPFVDNFLVDAEELWSKGVTGHIDSGIWVEVDDRGRSWALECKAAWLNGRALLLFQHLGAAYERQVNVLQKAREHVLWEEKLEEEVRRRTAQLRRREEEIVIRLLAVSGVKDEETAAHLRRIGLYAESMARSLGWNKLEVDNIRIAAPMHDIGKIGIPDSVLRKPGPLTPAEWQIMRRHPIIGAKMLGGSGLALLDMARDIAVGHHEKWDGSGYPSGLSGEEIPESARIVAVADVYDALVHQRVYKPAFQESDAIAQLTQLSGSHFDPQLLELFLSILPEIRLIRAKVPENNYAWIRTEHIADYA